MKELKECVGDPFIPEAMLGHGFAVDVPEGFKPVDITINRYSAEVLILVDCDSTFERISNLMLQESRLFDLEYRKKVYRDGEGTLKVYFLLEENRSHRGSGDIGLFEDGVIKRVDSELGENVQVEKIPNTGLVFTFKPE